MKSISEKQALLKLRELKKDFRARIRENYEHRAKDCLTCETQGICCTDAHFVNVHLTRLEAVLIRAELQKFSPAKRKEIDDRVAAAIEEYDLTADGDTFQKNFRLPAFRSGNRLSGSPGQARPVHTARLLRTPRRPAARRMAGANRSDDRKIKSSDL